MKTSQQQEQNKRVAYSAIAMARLEQDGECLSSGQMAEFVEERCDEAMHSAYLNHIGTCERCYGEWTALRQTYLAEKKETKLSIIIAFLSQRKGLYITGSALGTAVAVALFINILREPMVLKKESISVPDSIEFMEEAELSADEEQVQKEPIPPASPAPQPAAETPQREPAEPVDRPKPGKEKKSITAKPQRLERAGKSSLSNITEDKLSAAAPVQVRQSDVLQSLRESCIGEEKDEGNWLKVYTRLKREPQVIAAAPLGEKQAARILELLEALLSGEDITENCAAILKILEPETQK